MSLSVLISLAEYCPEVVLSTSSPIFISSSTNFFKHDTVSLPKDAFTAIRVSGTVPASCQRKTARASESGSLPSLPSPSRYVKLVLVQKLHLLHYYWSHLISPAVAAPPVVMPPTVGPAPPVDTPPAVTPPVILASRSRASHITHGCASSSRTFSICQSFVYISRPSSAIILIFFFL